MVDLKNYFKNFCVYIFMSFCFYLYFFNVGLCNVEITSKINRCVTCHTISGNSVVGTWPKIAEQHSDYMFKQLMEFKKGKTGNRFDPTMFGMLQGISEDEMLELSKHFSNQSVEKTRMKIDKEVYDKGRNIYLFGDKNNNIVACIGCHDIDGMGNKLAKYPVLRWQHTEYLMIQMKKFKSCDRSNDVNEIMRDVVKNMSEEQMEAVTAYISVME